MHAKVRGGSPEGRSETTGGGVGFVKQDWYRLYAGSEREMELYSGETEEEEVMGEGIGKQEMEELVLE